MEVKKFQISPEKGRVILNKGNRKLGGHPYEIFIQRGIFYASISHSLQPMVRETFEINSKKYPDLEDAVDARISELLW